MYRLLLFIRRVYVLLAFLVLEGFAIHYYANSSAFTKARLLTASNAVVGGIYEQLGGIGYFFSLGKTNRALEDKLAALENELSVYREYLGEATADSLAAATEPAYEYVVARVVRNPVNRAENYMMVDKGRRDGVERGMAVISIDGHMVGYVEDVSERNAICVSALNRSFHASGKIARTGDYGSISWPGGDARRLLLSEVPKYAEIERGDTVVTTGYSFYFPEGVKIGTIEDFQVIEATASYEITVRMGVDIWKLRNVMLIRNTEARERFKLEEDTLGTVVNP